MVQGGERYSNHADYHPFSDVFHYFDGRQEVWNLT